MLLPTMREVILSTARKVHSNIIKATGDQKWHRVRVHSVDLERYGRESGRIELIQREMETESDGVQLVWTRKWLLSPTAT